MNASIYMFIFIFTILNVKITCNKNEYIKVLVNKSYGGFSLSSDFLKMYKKIYNKELYNEDIYNSFLDKNHTNINIETRYNTQIINIFDKIGSAKSSNINSNIEIEYVPLSLINFININDFYGFETVSFK